MFDTFAVVTPSLPETRIISSILHEIEAVDCLQKFIDDFRDDDSLTTLGKLQAAQISLRYGMDQDKAAAFIAGCRARCRDRVGMASVQLPITSPAIVLSPTDHVAQLPSNNHTPLFELPPERQLLVDLPDCEGEVPKDDAFLPTQFGSTAVELIEPSQLEEAVAKDVDVDVDVDVQASSSVLNESMPQSTSSFIGTTPDTSSAHSTTGSQCMAVINVTYDMSLALTSPTSTLSPFASEWSRSKQIIFASIQVAHDNQHSVRFNFCNTGCGARRVPLLLCTRSRGDCVNPGGAVSRVHFRGSRAAKGFRAHCGALAKARDMLQVGGVICKQLLIHFCFYLFCSVSEITFLSAFVWRCCCVSWGLKKLSCCHSFPHRQNLKSQLACYRCYCNNTRSNPAKNPSISAATSSAT